MKEEKKKQRKKEKKRNKKIVHPQKYVLVKCLKSNNLQE